MKAKEKKLTNDFNKNLHALNQNDINESFIKLGNSDSSKHSKILLSRLEKEAEEFKISAISAELAEILSYAVLKKMFPKSEINYKLGSNSFPDIVVDNVGFEVKHSFKKETLGNSALQSSPGLEEIFVIIFHESQNAIIKKYEDIVNSIVVDHNPRFRLSLIGNNSFKEIFGMSLVEYLALSLEEKSKLVKNYLHSSRCHFSN